jgi:Family of unknown function (DUF6355)
MKLRRWAMVTAVAVGLAMCAQLASPPEAPAAPCGVYTTHVWWGADDVWYNHCGWPPVCIKVDVRYGSDYRREVGRGHTHLGTTAYVKGAWYIGLPHPTLRCRIY